VELVSHDIIRQEGGGAIRTTNHVLGSWKMSVFLCSWSHKRYTGLN
jgi:hypothetical protein